MFLGEAKADHDHQSQPVTPEGDLIIHNRHRARGDIVSSVFIPQAAATAMIGRAEQRRAPQEKPNLIAGNRPSGRQGISRLAQQHTRAIRCRVTQYAWEA